MKSSVWFGVGTGVVVLLAAGYFSGWFTSAVPVEAAVVRRGAIDEFIDEQAKTRLPQTYLITMPVQGRIEAIDLKEGDRVTAGKGVAQIVPRDLELAVKEATAVVQRLQASIEENKDVQVEKTAKLQSEKFVESTEASVKAAEERVRAGKAKSEYADSFFARIKQLYLTKTTSLDEYEAAALQKVQSNVDYKQDLLIHAAMTAMAAATDLMPTMVQQYIDRKGLTKNVLLKQKAEAEARLQKILQEQQRGEMQSPVSGTVLKRFVSNERFLTAGTPLLEIGQLQQMEVEADVLTLDVVAAKVGDEVEIYGPAIGEKKVKGRVMRIYPAGFTKISSLGVEQQRVKVIIRFDEKDLQRLLAERRLGVGYAVRVKIFTGKKSKTLIVPRSAMFRSTDNRWQVFAVRDGRAQLQTVTVDLMNDREAEIKKGLKEDDQVILAPESSLVDGTKVTVRETGR